VSATKAQSILSQIVDMIGADVGLLMARTKRDGAETELSLDDARRVAVYADRLEAIVRHEKARPLRDASLGDLIERAKRIPELADALRQLHGSTVETEPDDE